MGLLEYAGASLTDTGVTKGSAVTESPSVGASEKGPDSTCWVGKDKEVFRGKNGP